MFICHKNIVKVIPCCLIIYFIIIEISHAQSIDSNVIFGINVGYGKRLGGIPDTNQDFQDYAKSLRSGITIAAEGSYFYKPNWGVGLKYSRFSFDKTYTFNSQDPLRDGRMLSDKMTISAIGPQLVNRSFSTNEKHVYLFGVGVDYIHFKNINGTEGSMATLTGSSFGFNTDLGYEYNVSDKVALVFKVGLLLGSLGELETENDTGTQTIDLGDDPESLTRLDILGGIRFNLN